jgi:Tol biopolymer transport system component
MLSDVGQGDIWGLNVASPTLYRITDDAASDQSSTWLTDGRVVFASNRSGGYRLYVQPGDGRGEAARLIDAQTTQIAPSATPDGSGVVFTEAPLWTRWCRLLTLETGQVTSLVDTRSDERGGIVSPDGRWLAFESNRSDRFEVYVQRFPSADAAGVIPISTGGGVQPRWGPGAKELFYVAGEKLMAVPVKAAGSSFEAGLPTELFEAPLVRASHRSRYLVASNGQRFIVNVTVEQTTASPFTVVLNWLAAVKN